MTAARYLAAAAVLTASSAAADPFTFVALGDAPYGDPAKVYAPYEALIGKINDTNPAVVIHVGDTKSGGTECSDQILDDQKGFLNSFNAPVLYALGDNEWTDCHRKAAGGYDPVERLNYIRSTYFTAPGKSMGQIQADVTSQAAAGYPENMRMMLGDVMFVVENVVGSNNNFEPRTMANIEEFMARDTANISFLQQSFEAANAAGANALVLGIQADIFEFTFGPSWNPEAFIRHSGFAKWGEELKTLSATFGKPVLLVYGDSHRFRQSRPFADSAPNILALEVPGSKNMDAVEVTVDTATSGVFSVALIQNPDENW